MTATATHIETTVAAEDAPIGIQIWPTIAPGYAHHFTLDSVELVRDCNGEWVRWTYQDGKTRTFSKGEQVVVSYC